MAASIMPSDLQPAKAVVGSREESLVAMTLTLLGAGLRLYRVEANGYRLDEVWSLWMAKQSVYTIVIGILFGESDATPPTFYLLLHAILRFVETPLMVRAISVLAGTLMVWLTFRLALQLFDIRVAALSGLLMAIAPLHVEYSQVARAYVLSSMFALLAFFFFTQVVFGRARRWHWLGMAAAMAGSLYTFYLTALFILCLNALACYLWLRGRLAPGFMSRWLAAQAPVAVVSLPLAYAVLGLLPGFAPGRGQSWLGNPDRESLLKSAILFITGDPSYGPASITLPRALSLIVFLSICLMGTWLVLRSQRYRARRSQGASDGEVARATLVAGAAFVPWFLAYAISQVRPVYHEKYLLFVMPILFVTSAWVLTRFRQRIIALSVAVAIVVLNVLSLYTYYTAPAGEQWREAVAYVRSEYQQGDAVIISPGFYYRPFSYYFYGSFPENGRSLSHAPVVVVKNDSFDVVSSSDEIGPATASTSASRVWLLSGYAQPHPVITSWLDGDLQTLDDAEFLGVSVRLLRGPGDEALKAMGREE